MQLAPLLHSSAVIQLHVASALGAILLGGVVLFRRKGDRLHKVAGRVWAALMALAATSALFISEIRLLGRWSPIHLLALVVLATLVYAIAMARAGRIEAHRRAMQQLYVLALVVTGLFTLLPGRIMHGVVFGGGLWPGLALLGVGLGVGLGLTLWRLYGARRTQQKAPAMAEA